MTKKPPGIVRVDLDELGLDEIVAFGAYVHLERMDDGHIWIAIEAGGQHIYVNLTSKRKIKANVEDEGNVPTPIRSQAEVAADNAITEEDFEEFRRTANAIAVGPVSGQEEG